MKNKDEFRRTVWEKAERYEAQRRIKRKKIRESILLCSICIFIAIGVYLGTIVNLVANSEDLNGTNDVTDSLIKDGTNEESPNPEKTEPENSSIGPIQTTMTGAGSSTQEETIFTSSTMNTSATTVQTTNTETPTETESVIRLDYSFSSKPAQSNPADAQTTVLHSSSELAAYLHELRDQYNVPNLYVNSVQSSYNDEYFEKYSLIAVRIEDTHEYRFNSALSSYNHDGILSLAFSKEPDETAAGLSAYHFFITVEKGDYDKIEILTE